MVQEEEGGTSKQSSSMGDWSSVLPENSGKCVAHASEIFHLRVALEGITFVDFQFTFVNEPVVFLELE